MSSYRLRSCLALGGSRGSLWCFAWDASVSPTQSERAACSVLIPLTVLDGSMFGAHGESCTLVTPRHCLAECDPCSCMLPRFLGSCNRHPSTEGEGFCFLA